MRFTGYLMNRGIADQYKILSHMPRLSRHTRQISNRLFPLLPFFFFSFFFGEEDEELATASQPYLPGIRGAFFWIFDFPTSVVSLQRIM